MAYFDFVLGKVICEENLPADYNASQIAAMQASVQVEAQVSDDSDAIAGTRTSNTRFTRGSGTWTSNELAGKFIWSHASGTPGTGVFLKIASNTTTAIDIDADYGAGALENTGTAVIILDADTDVAAMKLLQNLSTWAAK